MYQLPLSFGDFFEKALFHSVFIAFLGTTKIILLFSACKESSLHGMGGGRGGGGIGLQ
jgi:hypothetical protein